MNGDILTQVDFRSMLDFHLEHKAAITVGACEHEVQVPYGVLETDGSHVVAINEKPVYKSFVNAGIYVVAADVPGLVPQGVRFDMPDLIRKLIAEGRTVACFPIREYWKDIGRVVDYEQAVVDAQTGKV